MSWTTCIVYNFADDLRWPELRMMLENIDYHEAARKASFLWSTCEDPLWQQFILKEDWRFDEICY